MPRSCVEVDCCICLVLTLSSVCLDAMYLVVLKERSITDLACHASFVGRARTARLFRRARP